MNAVNTVPSNAKTNGKHAVQDQSATLQAMAEELAKLKAENEALKAQKQAQPRGLTMKVSEKGALSIYGLGRFPITLYRGQWERLLAKVEEIKAFIEANAGQLKTKE